MATRNPVRVLPEPVGEATSTSRPAAMAGQAPDCGGVGPAGKRRANQLATAGWKSDSGEVAACVGHASGTSEHVGHAPIPPGCRDARGRERVEQGAQPGGLRPQQAIIGGWVRSSSPAATAARCWSISASVAMPCWTSSSRIEGDGRQLQLVTGRVAHGE